MSNLSKLTKAIFVLLILNILLNVGSFFILPDNIAMQINSNWDIHGSTLPKTLFLLLGPLVTLGAFLYSRYALGGQSRALVLSLIAFVGSGVTIAFNLIAL